MLFQARGCPRISNHYAPLRDFAFVDCMHGCPGALARWLPGPATSRPHHGHLRRRNKHAFRRLLACPGGSFGRTTVDQRNVVCDPNRTQSSDVVSLHSHVVVLFCEHAGNRVGRPDLCRDRNAAWTEDFSPWRSHRSCAHARFLVRSLVGRRHQLDELGLSLVSHSAASASNHSL